MSEASRVENHELMARAREDLRGNWKTAVLATLVYLVVTAGVQVLPAAGSVVGLIIAGPLAVGLSIFALNLARRQPAQVAQLFDGFRKFGVSLGAYLLILLMVLAWFLLLIVPGIIAAIRYSQTFYIIAEDDSVGPMDAIRRSKEMMEGSKWRYCCLGFRFIGWILLVIATAGVALLWVHPYIVVSFARFYDDLKANPMPVPDAAG